MKLLLPISFPGDKIKMPIFESSLKDIIFLFQNHTGTKYGIKLNDPLGKFLNKSEGI